MSRYAIDEREELCDTLLAAGPGAPTLCAPWTTSELLAHLVLRDRLTVSEAAGRLPFDPAREISQKTLERYVASHDYDESVRTFRAGPPRWSPLSVGPIREAVNLLEYAIHHEDVRRAGESSIEPRPMPVARQRAMWTWLRLAARRTLRQVPVGVRLVWPTHGEVGVGRQPQVTVSGDPLELALVSFGRQWVAEVAYDGDATAVSALTEARIAV